MCSHESVTWEKTDNSVADRMTENSLIHRFRSSRVLRRRTKVLNAKMKNRGVKDYRHYVELKTNVLRSLTDDADTEDSSSLTDVDYDIIYSSPSKQARYATRNFERYYVLTSEDDCEGCKSKQKKKSRGKPSTGRRVEGTKSLRAAVSEKCIDTGWQEVRKRTSGASRSCKRLYTKIADNEGDLQDNDFKARSSKQSLSPRLDSQNSTASSITTAGNKYMRQDRRDSVAMNELSSKDNTRFKKTKRVSPSHISDERKVQNRKNQSATRNESNTEFDSPDSHDQSSLSQSTCLENNIDSNNKLNSLVESETNNNSKLTTIIDESLINAKNYDRTCVSRKPELLKNVRRNLASALEEADSMNNDKDVKTDKYVENELNCDQSLPDITDFRHSIPLPVTKTQIDIREMKDSSPDQQKDSGIDEDSQDRFVKNIECNKVSMNQNTEGNVERMPISSPQPKKTDKLVETTEDCKEIAKDAHLRFNNDISGEQVVEEEKEHSEEEQMKNSSQLNQIDTNTIEEDEKDEQFLTSEDSNDIQKQQLLSSKQDCVEEAHSEHCNLIHEEEDNGKIKKPAEKEELSSQLNKMDNTEVDEVVSSINHEGKQDSEEEESSEKEIKNFRQLSSSGNITEIYSTNEDQTDFVKSKDSCDIQEQQVLSSKKNHKDVHNILEDNGQANEKKEEKHFPQLNDVDKSVKKQQLPKVTCTEVFNKKYKIINKKNIEINNEKINNINDNTDISNQDTPVKQNTLIHYPDAIDHSTDNWQEATISEEIDTPMALETDNEEDNMNYISPQTKKRLEQQARLNLVVSDSSESDDEYVTNKTSRKRFDNSDMSHCSDNDDVGSQESLTESLRLRVSESNVSCNTEESVNQFRRNRSASLLDKENMCINQKEETNVESETRRESEQRTQSSTECSNAHINISCQYRPRNIQQLVEDQELVIETMPTSFTIADLSDNEEAFIMNVPSKVVQSNLQGQPLTLKEKSIKFNKSKYRIVCKEVSTTSCIFATGKKRKPYKLINIKEISTITVREKLPQDLRKSNVSNTYDTVSSVSKSIKNDRQKIQDERNSKMLKVSNYRQKRKRRESSDSETRCQR